MVQTQQKWQVTRVLVTWLTVFPGGAPADLRDAAGKAPFEVPVMGMSPGDGTPNLGISPPKMRKSAEWLVGGWWLAGLS